ncbi:hypothetical protein V8V91_14030 [Algoriphagus halophilus]
MSEPNRSFVEGQISKLPMKLSAQGGVKFDLGHGGEIILLMLIRKDLFPLPSTISNKILLISSI